MTSNLQLVTRYNRENGTRIYVEENVLGEQYHYVTLGEIAKQYGDEHYSLELFGEADGGYIFSLEDLELIVNKMKDIS